MDTSRVEVCLHLLFARHHPYERLQSVPSVRNSRQINKNGSRAKLAHQKKISQLFFEVSSKPLILTRRSRVGNYCLSHISLQLVFFYLYIKHSKYA